VNLVLQNEEIIRRGVFEGVTHSSAKKYACKKGELILTSKNLSINCQDSWSKKIPIGEFHFNTREGILEVSFGFYGRHFLKLKMDNPKNWVESLKKVELQWMQNYVERDAWMQIERPKELKRLLDMKPEALKELYDALKVRKKSETKNIEFIVSIYGMSRRIKNRKLRAFIIAHCYVAFYEWTKRLLYKIHKVKFGKAPKNDEELMKFLDDYPSMKFLIDTSIWEIEPNQIRNCVSHEKFYYDYKNSELVFMPRKEKRIPLRELWRIIIPMMNFHSTILHFLAKKYDTLS